MAGGDLQGDVLHDLLEILSGDRGLFPGADFDQHADFRAGVDVGGDHAVAVDFHPGLARDLDVLANFGHHRDAVGLEIRGRIGGESLGDVVGKGAEHVVASNKVSLRVDLDEDAEASARGDILGNGAFAGFAAAFGGGSGGALLPENVHGGGHVAIGFGKRLFAIHHSRIGKFAQFANGGSSDFSHTERV